METDGTCNLFNKNVILFQLSCRAEQLDIVKKSSIVWLFHLIIERKDEEPVTTVDSYIVISVTSSCKLMFRRQLQRTAVINYINKGGIV